MSVSMSGGVPAEPLHVGGPSETAPASETAKAPPPSLEHGELPPTSLPPKLSTESTPSNHTSNDISTRARASSVLHDMRVNSPSASTAAAATDSPGALKKLWRKSMDLSKGITVENANPETRAALDKEEKTRRYSMGTGGRAQSRQTLEAMKHLATAEALQAQVPKLDKGKGKEKIDEEKVATATSKTVKTGKSEKPPEASKVDKKFDRLMTLKNEIAHPETAKFSLTEIFKGSKKEEAAKLETELKAEMYRLSTSDTSADKNTLKNALMGSHGKAAFTMMLDSYRVDTADVHKGSDLLAKMMEEDKNGQFTNAMVDHLKEDLSQKIKTSKQTTFLRESSDLGSMIMSTYQKECLKNALPSITEAAAKNPGDAIGSVLQKTNEEVQRLPKPLVKLLQEIHTGYCEKFGGQNPSPEIVKEADKQIASFLFLKTINPHIILNLKDKTAKMEITKNVQLMINDYEKTEQSQLKSIINTVKGQFN